MHQSTYKSWTALNKQMSKEKPLQFAVSFDSDEKGRNCPLLAVYVSIY